MHINWKRRLFVLAMLLVFAQVAAADIKSSLQEICGTIKDIVPVVAMLMFIIAGAVYAAGQVMGAETRARANVWSTAMLVGGMIGLMIAASAGYFVSVFSGFALGSTSSLTSEEVTC